MTENDNQVELREPAKLDRSRKLETLPPHLRLRLDRRIAGGETLTSLATEYGCSVQSMWAYKKRHSNRIAEIAADLANEFAGLWVANKENRLDAIEGVVRRVRAHPNADHHEWLKTELIALRNAAEELGQLPPKQTVNVVPVIHVVQGVNVDEELT